MTDVYNYKCTVCGKEYIKPRKKCIMCAEPVIKIGAEESDLEDTYSETLGQAAIEEENELVAKNESKGLGIRWVQVFLNFILLISAGIGALVSKHEVFGVLIMILAFGSLFHAFDGSEPIKEKIDMQNAASGLFLIVIVITIAISAYNRTNHDANKDASDNTSESVTSQDRRERQQETETENMDKANSLKRSLCGWFGEDDPPSSMVRRIKESMNDPESYEYVKTKCSASSGSVYIIITYRGKNAFGAKVLGASEGLYNLDGDLVLLTPIGD